jgi:hypothetical protein
VITENCTVLSEIALHAVSDALKSTNHMQSNTFIMYTNILVRRSGLFEREGSLIDDILCEKENVLVMIY